MWRFVAPAFEASHRVVLFDHVGASGVDPSAFDAERHATLHGYAADLLAICDELELDRPVFVGHSVSATIGVLAAAAEPTRFSHLVLLAPSPRFLDEPPSYVGGFSSDDIAELLRAMDANYVSWAGWVGTAAMANADRPELAAELTARFCSSDAALTRHLARLTFTSDHRADLARAEVDALVVQCARDALAPVEVGRYVAAHLPRATLRILDVEGHCPHISHPAETVAVIQRHLSEQRA